MLTLKKVKELVGAPSHAKRTPSPKMLYEEGIVLLRREFDQGSHLTVYNSGYVLFSAGKRNTVFHIHDCCGDYAYDAAEGKGDVIEEEYFENCEWHIRALFEGERKMEDNQAKCEGAGRSNVCVSYHALSEDWSEIADRTINMLEKIIENSDQGLCMLFDLEEAIMFTPKPQEYTDPLTGEMKKKQIKFFPDVYKDRIGKSYNDYIAGHQMNLFEDFIGYQGSAVLDEPEQKTDTISVPIPQCEESENIPLSDFPEQPENVQRPGNEVVEKGMLT